MGIYFSQTEITNLEELVSSLEPIQESIVYLSRDKVKLSEGLTTFKYLEKKLNEKNSPLSKEFLVHIKNQLDKRIDPIFLNNFYFLDKRGGSGDLTFLFENWSKLFGEQDKVFREKNMSLQGEENVDIFKPETRGSVKRAKDSIKLNEFILLEKINNNEKIEQTFKTKVTPFQQLTKEKTELEEKGNRGKMMESLYQAFNNINPSTVNVERVFSICGFIKNKSRNRMRSDLLDAIIFIRFYQLE